MIGDLIAGALPLLQAEAESMMTEQCVITRVTGKTLDETTLKYVPTTATVYAGPCQLQFGSKRVRDKDAQGQIIGAQENTLKLPAGTTGIHVNDVATITTTGIKVRVAGGFNQTHQTALRLPVEALEA